MKAKTLTELLRTTVTKGVENVLNEYGLLGSQMSPAAAYRLYGRSNIERWMHEGLIRYMPISGPSSRQFLDKRKLEAIAARSNRTTYLPVAER